MKTKLQSISIFLFCFGFCEPALSQIDTVKSFKESLNKTLYTPSARSSIVSPFSQLQLASNFGDEAATATFGFEAGPTQFSVKLKQSFKDKPRQSTLLKLEGLTNNTSVDVGFQYVAWRPRARFSIFEKIREEYARRKHISDTNQIRGITLLDLQKDSTAKRELDRRGVVKFRTPVIISVAYSGGRNDVDFIPDKNSIIPANQKVFNSNLKVSIGAALTTSSLLSFSFNFQSLYDLDDPISFNFPIGTSGANFNQEVVIGTPTKTQRVQFKLEYRKIFWNNEDEEPILALSPSMSVFSVAKSMSMELPVYLLRATKDEKFAGLQGGLSIAYTSPLSTLAPFKNGFGASLFVAVPFKLLSLL